MKNAVLGIYLVVFSNIVTNIIWVALVGVLAFSDLLVALKNKIDIRSFIKCHYIHILTIVLDIVALFFEYNGGRASVAPTENFNQTIDDLCRVYSTINKCCLGIMVIVCIIGTIYIIVKRKQKRSIVFVTLFAVIITEIITSLYLVALLAKVGDHKFLYTDNLIVLFFYFNLIFGICLAYLLSRAKKLLVLYPLCASFLVFFVMNVGRYSGNNVI